MGNFLNSLKNHLLSLFINLHLIRQECRCGNKAGRLGWANENGHSCSSPCKGNSSEICGGPNANSVYYLNGLNLAIRF